VGSTMWIGGASLLGVAAMPLVAGATPGDFSRALALDPQAYQGTWYELGRTPNGFEDNDARIAGVAYGPCTGSTAEYKLVSSTRVGVLNRCTRTALDGSGRSVEDVVDGVGLFVPDSDGRKLKIAFGNLLFRILTRVFTLGGADYWVFGVGPVGEGGLYEWALVSGPARDSIFVLTRTPDVPDDTLAEILRLAEAEGLPVNELVFDSQR
jgi:apolipoprotein D and lipocalin family protein